MVVVVMVRFRDWMDWRLLTSVGAVQDAAGGVVTVAQESDRRVVFDTPVM